MSIFLVCFNWTHVEVRWIVLLKRGGLQENDDLTIQIFESVDRESLDWIQQRFSHDSAKKTWRSWMFSSHLKHDSTNMEIYPIDIRSLLTLVTHLFLTILTMVFLRWSSQLLLLIGAPRSHCQPYSTAVTILLLVGQVPVALWFSGIG